MSTDIVAPLSAKHGGAATPERVAHFTGWAKERIEAMSTEPILWSKSATALGAAHVTFASGSSEAHTPVPAQDFIGDAGDELVAAVRAYAAAIGPPRLLVWRTEPEFAWEDGTWKIYARLCFVPAAKMKVETR